MRLEGKEVRQPVFAAEHVGNGKNACRQNADLDEGGDVAGIAIDDEVIGNAGRQDIATIKAMSVRKMAPENVPRESTAQARRNRPVCGRDASV